jgi:hypothetical protein
MGVAGEHQLATIPRSDVARHAPRRMQPAIVESSPTAPSQLTLAHQWLFADAGCVSQHRFTGYTIRVELWRCQARGSRNDISLTSWRKRSSR